MPNKALVLGKLEIYEVRNNVTRTFTHNVLLYTLPPPHELASCGMAEAGSTPSVPLVPQGTPGFSFTRPDKLTGGNQHKRQQQKEEPNHNVLLTNSLWLRLCAKSNFIKGRLYLSLIISAFGVDDFPIKIRLFDPIERDGKVSECIRRMGGPVVDRLGLKSLQFLVKGGVIEL